MVSTHNLDNIRYSKVLSALKAPVGNYTGEVTDVMLSEAKDSIIITVNKTESGDVEVEYAELWTENSLNDLYQKEGYSDLVNNPRKAVYKFLKERFPEIAKKLDLVIVDYDIYPVEGIGEVVLQVEMINPSKDGMLNEIMDENMMHPQDTQKVNLSQGGVSKVPIKSGNKFNQIHVTQNKPQNPKLVDILIKTVFNDKFDSKYGLSSDVGEWHPVKTLQTAEGKLFIQWDHEQTNKVNIQTTFFENNSNKISVRVMSPIKEVLIDVDFEVYRIPTDKFLAERFLRKVYFSLMKKFINSQIIKLEPFRRSFVFWKPNNPYFNYSFSEPRKNQILLDLIKFIKISEKPILDNFFEQNNLRHKQGYLQTLLDAAEDAGIFEYKRQGNEVMVIKGPNFKSFLDGRVRKF